MSFFLSKFRASHQFWAKWASISTSRKNRPSAGSLLLWTMAHARTLDHDLVLLRRQDGRLGILSLIGAGLLRQILQHADDRRTFRPHLLQVRIKPRLVAFRQRRQWVVCGQQQVGFVIVYIEDKRWPVEVEVLLAQVAIDERELAAVGFEVIGTLRV
jgi:hypothetical protein